MATYLQGVTDYIPQFQPFQPDLNFYGNVMQTKQTQYDTNWKSLNKMYGQYYHADLTRDGNVAKKDNYLKQIEFNLKRVSQLDLSLEQNVTQATQIFKPFYEDKSLMKDMAWTKNYNNQNNRAEIFKVSSNEKDRAQYWETGVREMQYLKDEFKLATDDEAMNFSNVEYTPYVNAVEKAQDVAKEAGLSIESVDFSKDGRWIVKTKNGQQLVEPLQKLFEARLGSDPAIQAVYKTQSFVNRKDYAYSNAAQFNGDKNAAELKYLENSFNVLKEKSAIRYKGLQENSKSYDNKIADIEKQIKDGKASPEAVQALEQYKMNKEINDKVLARAEQEQKDLNGGQSSTPTTSNGFVNPYGDLKSLRWKVDNGMASLLMQKDLDEAANIFAFKDAKQDMDANPYAVLADKHKYSMQQIATRNAGLANAAKIRNEGERKTMLDKARIDAGTHYQDEQTGEIKPIEALDQVFTRQNPDGTATPELDMRKVSKQIVSTQTKAVAIPYLKNVTTLIDDLVRNKTMTEKQASEILGYKKNPNINRKTFSDKLNKYGENWVTGEVGMNDLSKIKQKMSTWLSQNSQLSGLDGTAYNSFKKSSLMFDDYTNYLKADQEWKATSSKQVEGELRRLGYKYVDYLYDNNGKQRTKAEYFDALAKAGKINSSDAKYAKSYTGQKLTTGQKLIQGINPSNWLGMAIDAYNAPDIDYDELVGAANKVYSTGKVKAQVVGLDKLGSMSGSGVFAPNSSSIFVNPKGHTSSNIRFGEILSDMNGVDWGASNKNKISFKGTSLTSFNKAPVKNATGIALLDQIRAELTKSGKSKMGNFRVDVSPIAAGSINKAAVIIYPDAKWLKEQVYSTKKGADGKMEKSSAGLISATEYDEIMKNGVSYITDSANMTNSVYMSSYQSPLQSYVDYLDTKGQAYVYTDPLNSNYSFSIEKNKLGTGDYITSFQYPVWNSNTKEYVFETVSDNVTNYGQNMEQARFQAMDLMEKYKQINKGSYNGSR
jgi:hypothetical protein